MTRRLISASTHVSALSYNLTMDFEIVSPIRTTETIAQGHGIRDLARLRKNYGMGNWKKKKGFAKVRYQNGLKALVELHWYEAHGLGRREEKVKFIIEVLP